MSRKRIFRPARRLRRAGGRPRRLWRRRRGSSEDPQKVIESATFEGVESGNVDLTMNVKAEGENGGNMKSTSPVPSSRPAKRASPNWPWRSRPTATSDGENVDFEGGLTVLGDRAYVGFDGKNYEVDPTTFGFIKSGFEEAEQEGGEGKPGGSRPPARKRPTSIDLDEFVDNLENEGGEEVDGVKRRS